MTSDIEDNAFRTCPLCKTDAKMHANLKLICNLGEQIDVREQAFEMIFGALSTPILNPSGETDAEKHAKKQTHGILGKRVKSFQECSDRALRSWDSFHPELLRGISMQKCMLNPKSSGTWGLEMM